MMFGHANIESSISDMRILGPLMSLLMFVLMILLLRSVPAAVMTYVIFISSSVITVGLSAWYGVKINGATAIAPVIIMTLAMADCVHVFIAFSMEYGTVR